MMMMFCDADYDGYMGFDIKRFSRGNWAAIKGLEIAVILMIFFARMMFMLFFAKTILMQLSLYKLLFNFNLTS